ncbi:MAG: hypothetical protein ACTTJS_04210 [Wolinella sp.]
MNYSFDTIDIEAISSMRKGFYWLGRDYNDNLQEQLKDIIEASFKGEIPINELASYLKGEFSDIIKANEHYFQGVAEHITLQAQNMAMVSEGEKAGVEHYQIMALLDNRTTPICRSMHGRIIKAPHLKRQASAILNAKSLSAKKAAAAWRKDPYIGASDKLEPNFGLPPYHFGCRTEVRPVWIETHEIDGIKMKNTSPLKDYEALKHIDKIGVERVLKSSNAHISKKHEETTHQEIIKALNSITQIAPHNKNQKRTVATSQNGYFIVFEGSEIVTAYKPAGGLEKYFKNNAIAQKREVIKWRLFGL